MAPSTAVAALQQQQQCPALRQEEPCLAGFSCWWYTWQVGNWTSCVPLGQSSCGEGIMNRPVACLRSDGVKVEDSLCGEDGKPTPRETWCYVDCPIDCEVTPWTDWDTSHCSCGDTAGNMTRQRFIAVNPSDSGRACPQDLDQQRPCPSLPCYTWERGPWGHCKLEGGSCGHGTVERSVSCVGAGGERVPPSLCLQLFHVGGHTWPFLAHALDLNTRDSCFVSCSGGCELTEWSSWSHCHRDCGTGQSGGRQSRRRGILSPGVSGPASCPHDLQQSRGCLAAPCRSYAWQFRAGKPVCVRDDGVVVTVGCDEKQKPCYPGCAIPHSRCSVQGWCVCQPGHRALYSESQRYSLVQCVPDPALNSSVYAALPLAQRMMQSKLVPEQINVWMFAMIGVGTAFIIFVAISMYLLCSQGSREQTSFPLVSRSHSSTIRGQQQHRFNSPFAANIIANPQQPDDEQLQRNTYPRPQRQQQQEAEGLIKGQGVVELQEASSPRKARGPLDADPGSVGSSPDTAHNVTASSHLDLET